MNRDTFIAFLVVVMATLGLSGETQARELHGRFGLGYNGQFANTSQTNGVPGISVKYGLSRDLALGVVFGINTSAPNNSVIALKFYKNIFMETALNFYFFLGGGLLKANNQSATEFISGFGAEFFIPGIESLGFSTETGVSLNNISGSFGIQTLGISFLKAGIHFYF